MAETTGSFRVVQRFFRRFKYYFHGPGYVIFLCCFLSSASHAQQRDRYFIASSKVKFISKASLETIEAVSTELKGVIDTDTRSFAFTVHNNSFEGFNSPLQKDHFHENYLESGKNPNCTFSGKIIDEIDFSRDGTYPVRAKGILVIKGIGQERIIKGSISIKGTDLFLSADLSVLLSDHEIRIPRIVQQKIAPEIEVSIQAKLKKEVQR